MRKFERPEVLAPAGNYEKMTAAIRFGADAVYLAGSEFGMRTSCDNFTNDELASAAEYIHAAGKKMYLTVNTLPHGDEYPRLREFLIATRDMKIDGYIAADLGVVSLVKELLPDSELHISTQASICSPQAAKVYAAMGAARLVLARELTIDEIAEIRDAIPENVGLEAFVHGSMCVSYSGRCMLSNWMTGRDANKGACAQPCRWNYTLVEQKRPDERYPIEETNLGTFVMSSKDMCMIEHVGKLAAAGVNSFKIEGRVKSAYYTAVVANAYKNATLALEKFVNEGNNPADFTPDPSLMTELLSVSHRDYCTGFGFDKPIENAQIVDKEGYVRDKAYLAIADEETAIPENLIAENENGKLYRFLQRNKFIIGDDIELVSPGKTGRTIHVTELYNELGEAVDAVPHPGMIFYLRTNVEVLPGDIVRAH